jgi:hypothetical protein
VLLEEAHLFIWCLDHSRPTTPPISTSSFVREWVSAYDLRALMSPGCGWKKVGLRRCEMSRAFCERDSREQAGRNVSR